MSQRMDHGLRFLALLVIVLLIGSAALAEDASRTTGLPTDAPYRPVLVEISNTIPDRPQMNLSGADVVYEMIYWFPTHTRYIAVYNDTLPDQVGPIRGGRTYGLELMQAWDGLYLHRGGQDLAGTSINEYKQEQGITEAFALDYNKGQGRDIYFFAPDTPSENGLAANLDELVSSHWPTDPDTGDPHMPRDSGLVFSETSSATEPGPQEIRLYYGQEDNRPSFLYDAEAGGYVRSYNGEPYLEAGSSSPYVVQNVIVQLSNEYFYQGSAQRPVIRTTGEGQFTLYAGGNAVEGVWRRTSLKEPITYYLADGLTPAALLPGKTFIQMTPPHMYHDARTEGEAIVYTNEYWWDLTNAPAAELVVPDSKREVS